MKIFHEENMTKGWFIGNFEPSALKIDSCEVGLKRYKAGDCETAHVHRVATEVTFIVEGKVNMNGVIYNKGDIIKIDPGEGTDFSVIEDTITLVVKAPCVPGDKYAVHIA